MQADVGAAVFESASVGDGAGQPGWDEAGGAQHVGDGVVAGVVGGEFGAEDVERVGGFAWLLL
ncbi:hypothetical protein [Kitasatospora purpeofusca]|uniref:hypothetical protein n=1 Tax=Kitasatospora purpeofusca TaxID=67352 RepID=UPI00382F6248